MTVALELSAFLSNCGNGNLAKILVKKSTCNLVTESGCKVAGRGGSWRPQKVRRAQNSNKKGAVTDY